MKIHPVILSGGSGTRLWPLSRAAYPKQLMPLVSTGSLLQETVQRVGDRGRFTAPLLICNDEHRFMVAEQLHQNGVVPDRIVLEPIARNTARSEEHTSELQSLMRISYAVFCLKKKQRQTKDRLGHRKVKAE